jgi:L-cysteine/cystine lyase
VTFEEAREAFPVLERAAYLNAGTNGPLSRATVAVMAEQAARELEHGRSGKTYYESIHALRARTRAALSAVLGVVPELVALATSTTNACNIVLAGLDLRPEDEVVTTDVEHFGLLGPLYASRARVRVARIRDLPPEGAFDTILAEVGPRTRLVALSHISWMTGNVLPVEELQEALETPLLVDAAQSAGAIPVEAGRFDFYAVSGQKWLCGPDATGALVVCDPERLRPALPTYFSQESYEDTGEFVPRAGAARFDAGSIALPALAGLATAIETAPEWRFERARGTAERCRELLAERFEVVTAPEQATLVTFRPGGDTEEAVARLAGTGVVVRSVPRTDWIRVSVGYWTSDEDLERLLDSLQQ